MHKGILQDTRRNRSFTAKNSKQQRRKEEPRLKKKGFKGWGGEPALPTPALKQAIDMEEFKRQLLDFIEDRDEPFTVRFLVESCLQPVGETLVQNALADLENEGLVIWLGGGEWISTKAVMKRALKPSMEVILPKSLVAQIISTAIKRPDLGYTSLAEFIRDAVKNFIKQHSV
jgi:hypothetical protein